MKHNEVMDAVSRLNHRLFAEVNTFARHTGWLHAPLRVYADYGVVLFGLLLFLGVLTSRSGNARSLAAAAWSGFAAVLAVAVNQPIVQTVHESRPYTSHSAVLVLVDRTTDFSFPSDHATMAGATAVGLFLVTRTLGLLASGAALAMAFTRIYVGAHYPGDVLAGLLLGATVAALGWLLVQRPATRAAEWLRHQQRLRPLLLASTGK